MPGGGDAAEDSLSAGAVVPPGSLEDIEDRSIDEHLYAGWLTQIRNPSSPDADVDLSKQTELIETLVATPDEFGAPAGGAPRVLPRAVWAPPQEAAEAPVAVYRWISIAVAFLIFTGVLASYQLWIPQRRAETYRERMVTAVGDLRGFNESYRDVLGGQLPTELREIAAAAKSSIAGVASFRRSVADEAPRRLPLTAYPGRPDPANLRADAVALLEALDPLYEQVQLRASLYGTLADYSEQIDIASNVVSGDGLEGGDRSIVLRGVASNLEAIRASLLGVAVPVGCEELHRRIVASLDHLISVMKSAVAAGGGASGTAQMDLMPVSAGAAAAKSALQTPVRQGVPPSSLDAYDARLADFTSRYGSR